MNDIEKAIKGLENIIEYWTYKPEEIETAKLAIQALREKQERDNNVCFNCKYLTMLERNAELNGQYWHCGLCRGKETKNVWHKYSKHYRDYSLVEMDDFCSYFEPKEKAE